MFTGIIESLGKIKSLSKEGENLHIEVASELAPMLKIDQSVSHNGVCLTVVSLTETSYVVTAIKETLDKTNIGQLEVGAVVNLERAMKLGDRLDGHIVQGHVDQTAICQEIKKQDGSWVFTFTYDSSLNNITIEKGSVTVNGVSLTVVDSRPNTFNVAIIPYTYQHTNFDTFVKNTMVNLEFDVIGKYVKRITQGYL